MTTKPYKEIRSEAKLIIKAVGHVGWDSILLAGILKARKEDKAKREDILERVRELIQNTNMTELGFDEQTTMCKV